jgi:hypothetical protein
VRFWCSIFPNESYRPRICLLSSTNLNKFSIYTRLNKSRVCKQLPYLGRRNCRMHSVAYEVCFSALRWSPSSAAPIYHSIPCSAYILRLGKRRPGRRRARAWARERGPHQPACPRHLLHTAPPQEPPLAAPPPTEQRRPSLHFRLWPSATPKTTSLEEER